VRIFTSLALTSLMTVVASSTSGAQEPDWPSAHRETLANLQSMIRLNTVNPPGNEMQVGKLLDSALRSAGIETHLFEPAPGRASVVARIRGNGSKQPVLIMAHMDVVGVEREHWSVDPFAAEVKDGYVYGRGAIDDKGMLAVNLETMLLLKRNVVDKGHTLSRDVIFVANSDEEQNGDFGMGWLIQNHPELIRAEFALNEGGRTRIVGGKLLYVAVQNTEKVPHTVTVTAHGPGGHASIPLEGNAILRLGRALAKISMHREPTYLTPSTRKFFKELGAVWPQREERQAMLDVASDDTEQVEYGARVLTNIPVFDAVLRTGISATIIAGGIRSNVIPTDATATLNVRTLPGQKVEDVVKRLQGVVNDSLVEIRIASLGEDSPASDFHSPMFEAIRASARALDTSLTVVPYLSTGATDSARLRIWGMQAFGLLPFPMDQGDEDRMHGNDERVPLKALEFGTQMIYGAVLRVAQ
jgi:acetylornithine deacetylase/succinyl-diaminopimelate desuccinylase-like protein